MIWFLSNALFKFVVDDETVIEIVKEQIDYMEKVKKSWIICGFPRTKVQALSLQRMCVIPDKIISMTADNLACRSSINAYVQRMIPGIFGEEIDEYAIKIRSEHELSLNGVKDTFNHFIFHYDTTGNPFEQTVQDLGRMINLRFRVNAPRRPPRVIILGPPGSGRSTTSEIISKRFGLVNVSPM